MCSPVMAGDYSSDELFSDTEKNLLPDDGDGRASPEIPIQSKSLSIVPRWCFEEGLVNKPGAGSESDSSEEDVPRKKRCVRREKVSRPKLEEDIQDIKALLQTVANKVDRNKRCLKELQESRLVVCRLVMI